MADRKYGLYARF